MSMRRRRLSRATTGTTTTLLKKGSGEYNGAVMKVGNYVGSMYVRDCGDVTDFGLSPIIDILEIECDVQGRSSQKSPINNRRLFTSGLAVSVSKTGGAAGNVDVVVKYKQIEKGRTMLRTTCIEENVTNPLLIKKGTCIYGGAVLSIAKIDGVLKVYDCGAVGDIADSKLIDIVGIEALSEGMDRTKGGMQFNVDEASSCIQVTNGIVAALTGGGTVGVIGFK